MASFATFSDDTSGTPAPSKVPSMREKRTSAKCATTLPSSGTRSARSDERSGSTRQIWVLVDGQPKAVDVQLGLSNGRQTEVSGPGLQPGMAVITEQQSGTAP